MRDDRRVRVHMRMSRRFALAAMLATFCMISTPVGVAAALPAPPAALKPPAKPAAMPAFALPTTDGSPLRSDTLRGQVVIVRFWASW